MNLKEIKEILEMMKNADVIEFEMEKENTRIRIKKLSDLQHQVVQQPHPQQIYSQPAIAVPAAQQVLPEEKKTEATQEIEKYLQVKSPMVGTFYRSSAPDSPAYVQEGDMISEGQTLCIIEAMKLMNEIKSEIRGKVVKIVIENGQAVEYNQMLFLIEPVDKGSV